jgi:glycosyl transferase family 25
MNILNTFFDKILVIALKEDEERVQSIKENLKDFDFEFLWGVNMKHLFANVTSNKEIPEQFFHEHNVNRNEVLHWSKGGIGCGISHRNAIKYVVDNKLQKALILEDDVFFDNDLNASFEKAIPNIPKDWELLYLGYDYPTRFHKDYFRIAGPYVAKFKTINVLGMEASDKSKNFFPKKVNHYIDRAGVYMGGHAYALTLEGATKLLHENTPIKHYSDPLLMHMIYHNKIKAYNLRKPLIFQNKALGSGTDASFKVATH